MAGGGVGSTKMPWNSLELTGSLGYSVSVSAQILLSFWATMGLPESLAPGAMKKPELTAEPRIAC